MKRPLGVTFSAIILLLGSSLQVLMALGMALSGAVLPTKNPPGTGAQHVPMPGWMPLMMYIFSAFVLGLALWGIVTAIGLFRLRRWARYSLLVIAGCLAFFGLISVLSTLVMVVMPLTPPPGADVSALDPGQAHTIQIMTRFIFAAMAFFYGIVCAIGVSWLIYFNRKTWREAFAGRIADGIVGGATATPLMAVPSRRPVLITVIAVLNMFGAVTILLGALLPIPAMAFGVILHGWGKVATYLVYCCLQAAVGIGLWRMQEWGRRLTLGVLALGVAQSVFYAFRPSLIVRYTAEINKLISPVPPALPARFQNILFSASFGFSFLFCIAIAVVLIYYRRAFLPEVAPPADSAAA
jgi:hypothetical protein